MSNPIIWLEDCPQSIISPMDGTFLQDTYIQYTSANLGVESDGMLVDPGHKVPTPALY